MVGYFKRPDGENVLDARIAGLSQRRALSLPVAVPPPSLAPEPVIELAAGASQEDRLLKARAEVLARLNNEIRPERRLILSRGELAKIVETAVQAYLPRHAIEVNALERRDLITALMQALLTPPTPEAEPEKATGQRHANRSAVEAAKGQIQPLLLEHMDVAAAAGMPRATFEA